MSFDDAAMAVVEAVPVPIAVVDGKMQVKYVNGSFAGMAGLKKSKLEGRKWRKVFPPGLEAIRRVRRTGRPLTLKGCKGWPGASFADVSLYPLNQGEAVTLVLITVAGVPPAGQAAAGERVEIGHYLAHQLRAPLATAKMAVEMLCSACSRGDSARVEAARSIINRNLDRQLLFVENIVAPSGGAKGRRRRFSIAELLREVLKENREVIESMGMGHSLVVDGRLPPLSLVRPDIKRVFNRIVRSVLLCCEGGELAVRVRKRGSFIAVALGNTGKGKAARNTFSRRFRSLVRGLGAGGELSFCRSIIERAGGKIDIRPWTVTVRIPMKNSAGKVRGGS